MKVFNFPVHSIIIMVGPSMSGKSTFVDNHLIPQLQTDDMRVHKVSSDNIRSYLLGGGDYTKDNSQMMQVSTKAFDLLEKEVDLLASYPNQSHYIVVDSTGLNQQFRSNIAEIARTHNYNVGCVMMAYKDKNQYFEHIGDEVGGNVVKRHLNKLNKYAFSEIRKKDYAFVHKIEDPDFNNYQIESDNLKQYREFVLNGNTEDYIIIGDIHGCYDELIELLTTKFNVEVDENDHIVNKNCERIILIGDIIDKGPKIKEVIEFVHKNLDSFLMVKGNHENFVYKWMNGEIEQNKFSQEFLDTNFETIKLLEADDDLWYKFVDIFCASREFYLHTEFVVTHAPCSVDSIGKLDNKSLRNQRSEVLPKRHEFDSIYNYNKARDKQFEFMREKYESDKNLPVHIFGHITTKNVSTLGSKMNIDTSCATGNHLTGVVINTSGKPFIQKVRSHQPRTEIPEWNFFERRVDIDVDVNTLERREKGRILTGADNKVNFISGTMSPSNKKENILESLDAALDYYKNQGMKEVVLQPKYMGSRCNLYVHKDINKCYGVTRKGFIIKHVDLNPVFRQLHKIPFIRKGFDHNNVKLFILDSELLPWRLLGENLIDKDFISIEKAVQSENNLLEQNGFEQKLNEVKKEYDESEYEQLRKELTKKELKNHFNAAKERTLRHFREYYTEKYYPLSSSKKDLDEFKKQVDIYGRFNSEPYSKPFAILKTIYNDGSEQLHFNDRNDDMFNKLNEDGCETINLDNVNAYELAYSYYNKIVNENMEGIVVKPDVAHIIDVAPFLKVRNPQYLMLAYGYDYKHETKYDKLLKRKKIGKKLGLSVSEYNIGKQMLEIPYDNISSNNQHYINLFYKMIKEQEKEEEVDPRL